MTVASFAERARELCGEPPEIADRHAMAVWLLQVGALRDEWVESLDHRAPAYSTDDHEAVMRAMRLLAAELEQFQQRFFPQFDHVVVEHGRLIGTCDAHDYCKTILAASAAALHHR